MTVLMTNVQVPEKAAILTPAERKLAEMEAIVIDSPDMAEIVSAERTDINRALKNTEEQRLAIIRKIDESKEPVNTLFRPVVELLKRAKDIADRKLLAWNDQVRREQEAEQRRLQEEERRRQQKAEEEAAAIRAKADADAQALREKAAAAAAAGDVGKAAKLETQAENKLATADAKVESVVAAVVPAPVLAAPPKVSSTDERMTYSAEVEDFSALVKFCASNPMFVGLLQVNQPALNAQARSLKKAFAIPGCKLIEKRGIADSRSRATEKEPA